MNGNNPGIRAVLSKVFVMNHRGYARITTTQEQIEQQELAHRIRGATACAATLSAVLLVTATTMAAAYQTPWPLIHPTWLALVIFVSSVTMGAVDSARYNPFNILVGSLAVAAVPALLILAGTLALLTAPFLLIRYLLIGMPVRIGRRLSAGRDDNSLPRAIVQESPDE